MVLLQTAKDLNVASVLDFKLNLPILLLVFLFLLLIIVVSNVIVFLFIRKARTENINRRDGIMSLIVLKDIKKVYSNKNHNTFALNGINLTINKGEMIAVMGLIRLREEYITKCYRVN